MITSLASQFIGLYTTKQSFRGHVPQRGLHLLHFYVHFPSKLKTQLTIKEENDDIVELTYSYYPFSFHHIATFCHPIMAAYMLIFLNLPHKTAIIARLRIRSIHLSQKLFEILAAYYAGSFYIRKLFA